MRIAILADPLDYQRGGIHYYTDGLIQGLMEIEPAHEIILFRKQEDNNYDFTQIAIRDQFSILGYNVKRKFYDIPKALQRSGVDVVFEPAHFGPFNLPEKIKRVTMIHDLTPVLFPEWHPFVSSWLQRIFLPGILKRADLILANSNHTARDIQSYIPSLAPKIQTIHLGLNREFITADLDVDKPKNLPEQYILFVSTIEPRKNLSTLLSAFASFKKQPETESIQLVICGQIGWKSQSIIQQINNHPNADQILLTKYVDREYLLAMYGHARVLVYPSYYEGFGLPIIEALACGTPVIASNNSSIPEVGGNQVHYFETKNVAQLATLLMQIDKHKDASEIIAKRQEYAQSFSWSKYARKFVEAIETLF